MSVTIPAKTLATAGLPDEGIYRLRLDRANLVERENRETQEKYHRIEVMFRLVERYGDATVLNFQPVVFDNFSLSVKALPRFIGLYQTIVGSVPTGEINPETGEPDVDVEAMLDDIRGTDTAWGVITYGDKKANGTYRINVGWKFSADPENLAYTPS